MLEKGLKYTSTCEVGSDNIAAKMGSGDLDVFATPAMIALMESAAMNAVKNALPAGSSSVGIVLNVAHLKATPIGDIVEATATLTEVDGRKLVFAVTAKDSRGIIGKGTHERFVVDKERFMAKLR